MASKSNAPVLSPLGHYFERVRKLAIGQGSWLLQQHKGLRGRVREHIVSRLLEEHLPTTLEVLGGVELMDHRFASSASGGTPRELDVVVCRRDMPRFAAGSVLPVEAAIACIEVKSCLDQKERQRILEQSRWLRALQRVPGVAGVDDGVREPRPLIGVVTHRMSPGDRKNLMHAVNEEWRVAGPDFVLDLRHGLLVRREAAGLCMLVLDDADVQKGQESAARPDYVRVFDWREAWRGVAALVFEITARAERLATTAHDFAPYVSGRGPRQARR